MFVTIWSRRVGVSESQLSDYLTRTLTAEF